MANAEPPDEAPPEALPVETYIQLLNAAAELSGDEHFGLHVGERMKLATYAIYGIVLLACRNFGEAMQQVMRYEVLAHDLGRSQLQLEQGSARYVWHSQWSERWPCRHLAESVCAGILAFVEWVAQRPVPIVDAVNRLLAGEAPAKAVVAELLARPLKAEGVRL